MRCPVLFKQIRVKRKSVLVHVICMCCKIHSHAWKKAGSTIRILFWEIIHIIFKKKTFYYIPHFVLHFIAFPFGIHVGVCLCGLTHLSSTPVWHRGMSWPHPEGPLPRWDTTPALHWQSSSEGEDTEHHIILTPLISAQIKTFRVLVIGSFFTGKVQYSYIAPVIMLNYNKTRQKFNCL